MPQRRRPLIRPTPVGGDEREARVDPVADADRIEALTRLKGLLDSGILTQEQYESERRRLTEEG